jgi:glycosyltransferase involved in cell wall biosynthesis
MKQRTFTPTELTVITPAFNGLTHLRDCLESVAACPDPRIEHLVVDGGSSDGSVELLAEWGRSRGSAFRWVSEPDEGQSDAMNKGIRMAGGRWIGFLNADDLYLPGTLARVLKLVDDRAQDAFLVGNCRILGHGDTLIATIRPAGFRWYSLYHRIAETQFPVNPSSYFYPRSVHDRIGGYKQDDHYTMDLDFLLRATPGLRYCYFDEDWGAMRLLPGCKTYEDRAAGTSGARIRATVRSNYLALPLWRRSYSRFLRRVMPSRPGPEAAR